MTSYIRQKFGLKLSLSSPPESDQYHREKENGSEAASTAVDTETTNAASAAAANGVEDDSYDVVDERYKIKEVRALLLSHHPSSSQDVDDLMIRRFLRARDHHIEKTSHMLFKYLTWRKEFVPDGFISPLQIPNELAQNKFFMQGHDKLHRPIMVALGGRHTQTTPEEFKRFNVFFFDKICSRMSVGQEKCVCIADLKGWGYANCDIRGSLTTLSLLQDYYPERLGKLFIVNVPYVFMTAWKMIYPFIDSNTKKKIIFVENKQLKSILLSDIDESQLPEIYGGKLPLVPIQDC